VLRAFAVANRLAPAPAPSACVHDVGCCKVGLLRCGACVGTGIRKDRNKVSRARHKCAVLRLLKAELSFCISTPPKSSALVKTAQLRAPSGAARVIAREGGCVGNIHGATDTTADKHAARPTPGATGQSTHPRFRCSARTCGWLRGSHACSYAFPGLHFERACRRCHCGGIVWTASTL